MTACPLPAKTINVVGCQEKRPLAVLAMAVLALGGCVVAPTDETSPTWEKAAANPIIPANYRAAEALLAQLGQNPGSERTMIVATAVNIDVLEKSSTLGRLISEQVAARFTYAGHRMIEMKFGNAVYMKRDQGELMLTREISNLAKNHDAQAVIVGTYGESQDFVYVNLKVIQPTSNVVLAVHDYTLPRDNNIKSLLRKY